MLDADLIGRACPELHMTKAAMHGVSAAPCFLADARGNVLIIEESDHHVAEGKARAHTASSGSVMALSTYFLKASIAKKARVIGSYSLARSNYAGCNACYYCCG